MVFDVCEDGALEAPELEENIVEVGDGPDAEDELIWDELEAIEVDDRVEDEGEGEEEEALGTDTEDSVDCELEALPAEVLSDEEPLEADTEDDVEGALPLKAEEEPGDEKNDVDPEGALDDALTEVDEILVELDVLDTEDDTVRNEVEADNDAEGVEGKGGEDGEEKLVTESETEDVVGADEEIGAEMEVEGIGAVVTRVLVGKLEITEVLVEVENEVDGDCVNEKDGDVELWPDMETEEGEVEINEEEMENEELEGTVEELELVPVAEGRAHAQLVGARFLTSPGFTRAALDRPPVPAWAAMAVTPSNRVMSSGRIRVELLRVGWTRRDRIHSLNTLPWMQEKLALLVMIALFLEERLTSKQGL